MASVTDYKNALKVLLDSITFDSSTLGTLGIVKTYERSIKDKPNTIINIFNTRLTSSFLETRINSRAFRLVIRIRILAAEREEQAQIDMDYLEEAIIQVLENNMNNAAWGDGQLVTDTIESESKNFGGNDYVKDIPVIIAKRVSITV